MRLKRIGANVAAIWWLFLAQIVCGETLTVATYNIENYVATNRMVEGTYREEYPKPEEAKAALRAVIRALNADVLALQEMGPRPYLEELRRDLAKEGLEYRYAELAEASDPDRHTAVLSRKPFASVKTHADLEFKYFGQPERVKRGLLEVRLAVAGGEIAIFVVHLKSRFTDREDDPESLKRRTGEAVAVRDRVLKIFPKPDEQRFLIVGDFNDTKASKPLGLLTKRGKTKVAEILGAADSRGDAWTHHYRKEDTYSRVDFILVSPALKEAVAGGAGRVLDGPEVKRASDHRPVMVTLELE